MWVRKAERQEKSGMSYLLELNMWLEILVFQLFILNRGCKIQEKTENYFQVNLFYSISDVVTQGLRERFIAVRDICMLLSFRGASQ